MELGIEGRVWLDGDDDYSSPPPPPLQRPMALLDCAAVVAGVDERTRCLSPAPLSSAPVIATSPSLHDSSNDSLSAFPLFLAPETVLPDWMPQEASFDLTCCDDYRQQQRRRGSHFHPLSHHLHLQHGQSNCRQQPQEQQGSRCSLSNGSPSVEEGEEYESSEQIHAYRRDDDLAFQHSDDQFTRTSRSTHLRRSGQQQKEELVGKRAGCRDVGGDGGDGLAGIVLPPSSSSRPAVPSPSLAVRVLSANSDPSDLPIAEMQSGMDLNVAPPNWLQRDPLHYAHMSAPWCPMTGSFGMVDVCAQLMEGDAVLESYDMFPNRAQTLDPASHIPANGTGPSRRRLHQTGTEENGFVDNVTGGEVKGEHHQGDDGEDRGQSCLCSLSQPLGGGIVGGVGDRHQHSASSGAVLWTTRPAQEHAPSKDGATQILAACSSDVWMGSTQAKPSSTAATAQRDADRAKSGRGATSCGADEGEVAGGGFGSLDSGERAGHRPLLRRPPDIICRADDMKKLIMSPYSSAPLSFVVHRVGPSVVVEGVMPNRSRTVTDARSKAIQSKLLYYSILTDDDAGALFHLPYRTHHHQPNSTSGISGSTNGNQHRSMGDHVRCRDSGCPQPSTMPPPPATVPVEGRRTQVNPTQAAVKADVTPTREIVKEPIDVGSGCSRSSSSSSSTSTVFTLTPTTATANRTTGGNGEQLYYSTPLAAFGPADTSSSCCPFPPPSQEVEARANGGSEQAQQLVAPTLNPCVPQRCHRDWCEYSVSDESTSPRSVSDTDGLRMGIQVLHTAPTNAGLSKAAPDFAERNGIMPYERVDKGGEGGAIAECHGHNDGASLSVVPPPSTISVRSFSSSASSSCAVLPLPSKGSAPAGEAARGRKCTPIPPQSPSSSKTPPDPPFKQILHWRFDDLHLLVGTNTHMYRHPVTNDKFTLQVKQHVGCAGQMPWPQRPPHHQNHHQADKNSECGECGGAKEAVLPSSPSKVYSSFSHPSSDTSPPLHDDMEGANGDATPTCSPNNLTTPISKQEALDFWLENIMTNVEGVAICFHSDGIVQGYQVVSTQDLPSFGTEPFEPIAVQRGASNLMHWLTQCCSASGSYVLVKGTNESTLRLYSLAPLYPSTSEGAGRSHAYYMSWSAYQETSRQRQGSKDRECKKEGMRKKGEKGEDVDVEEAMWHRESHPLCPHSRRGGESSALPAMDIAAQLPSTLNAAAVVSCSSVVGDGSGAGWQDWKAACDVVDAQQQPQREPQRKQQVSPFAEQASRCDAVVSEDGLGGTRGSHQRNAAMVAALSHPTTPQLDVPLLLIQAPPAYSSHHQEDHQQQLLPVLPCTSSMEAIDESLAITEREANQRSYQWLQCALASPPSALPSPSSATAVHSAALLQLIDGPKGGEQCTGPTIGRADAAAANIVTAEAESPQFLQLQSANRHNSGDDDSRSQPSNAASLLQQRNPLHAFWYPMGMMCLRMARALPNSDAETLRLLKRAISMFDEDDPQALLPLAVAHAQCMAHFHSSSPLTEAENECLRHGRAAVNLVGRHHLFALASVDRAIHVPDNGSGDDSSDSDGSDDEGSDTVVVKGSASDSEVEPVESANRRGNRTQPHSRGRHRRRCSETRWRRRMEALKSLGALEDQEGRISGAVLRCMCAIALDSVTHGKLRLAIESLSIAQDALWLREQYLPRDLLTAPPCDRGAWPAVGAEKVLTKVCMARGEEKRSKHATYATPPRHCQRGSEIAAAFQLEAILGDMHAYQAHGYSKLHRSTPSYNAPTSKHEDTIFDEHCRLQVLALSRQSMVPSDSVFNFVARLMPFTSAVLSHVDEGMRAYTRAIHFASLCHARVVELQQKRAGLLALRGTELLESSKKLEASSVVVMTKAVTTAAETMAVPPASDISDTKPRLPPQRSVGDNADHTGDAAGSLAMTPVLTPPTAAHTPLALPPQLLPSRLPAGSKVEELTLEALNCFGSAKCSFQTVRNTRNAAMMAVNEAKAALRLARLYCAHMPTSLMCLEEAKHLWHAVHTIATALQWAINAQGVRVGSVSGDGDGSSSETDAATIGMLSSTAVSILLLVAQRSLSTMTYLCTSLSSQKNSASLELQGTSPPPPAAYVLFGLVDAPTEVPVTGGCSPSSHPLKQMERLVHDRLLQPALRAAKRVGPQAEYRVLEVIVDMHRQCAGLVHPFPACRPPHVPQFVDEVQLSSPTVPLAGTSSVPVTDKVESVKWFISRSRQILALMASSGQLPHFPLPPATTPPISAARSADVKQRQQDQHQGSPEAKSALPASLASLHYHCLALCGYDCLLQHPHALSAVFISSLENAEPGVDSNVQNQGGLVGTAASSLPARESATDVLLEVVERAATTLYAALPAVHDYNRLLAAQCVDEKRLGQQQLPMTSGRSMCAAIAQQQGKGKQQQRQTDSKGGGADRRPSASTSAALTPIPSSRGAVGGKGKGDEGDIDHTGVKCSRIEVDTVLALCGTLMSTAGRTMMTLLRIMNEHHRHQQQSQPKNQQQYADSKRALIKACAAEALRLQLSIPSLPPSSTRAPLTNRSGQASVTPTHEVKEEAERAHHIAAALEIIEAVQVVLEHVGDVFDRKRKKQQSRYL